MGKVQDFSHFEICLGALICETRESFLGPDRHGNSTLSASGVPPPSLESILVQWAPVCRILFDLETFCLPGTFTLIHLAQMLQDTPCGKTAEIPPKGTGISTVMTLSSPDGNDLLYCGKTQLPRSFTEQSPFSGSAVLKIPLWK